MGEPPDRRVRQLSFRVPQHRAEGAVPLDDRAIDRDEGHADWRVIECLGEALFAGAQRRFGVPAGAAAPPPPPLPPPGRGGPPPPMLFSLIALPPPPNSASVGIFRISPHEDAPL